MNDQLLEELLNDEEGSALDFKQAQYRFDNASDEDKSELLKDILAFANASRRVDAYILVGVRDIKGARKEIMGLPDSELLDDSRIQQFVNSKTNKKITFSYRIWNTEGKKIAVIHIPKQSRPHFTRQKFGKVEKEAVYIRRGSATDVAPPDEIAAMGMADHVDRVSELNLGLQFVDFNSRVPLGIETRFTSVLNKVPDTKLIPDFPSSGWGVAFANVDYLRELAKYFTHNDLYRGVHVGIRNDSAVTATDVRVVFEFPKSDGLLVLEDVSTLEIPSKVHVPLARSITDLNNRAIEFRQTLDVVYVTVYFGKIQPRAVEIPSGGSCIYVGARRSCDTKIRATIFADNLPSPITAELRFIIDTLDGTEIGIEAIRAVGRKLS